MKLKELEDEIQKEKNLKKKNRKKVNSLSPTSPETSPNIMRKTKTDIMRQEIKSKVQNRIEEIIHAEIEKVRRPKAIAIATKVQFDELSSVKDILQGS